MTTWKISNVNKKSAVDVQHWTKGDVTIKREEGFRWGVWSCESDEKPEIDLNNPDGFDTMSDDYDWEMEEMSDGCWAEWIFPDDMSDEEREAIEAAYDDMWEEGLEELGWHNTDGEHFILGPIRLTNADTGEEWEGEEQ